MIDSGNNIWAIAEEHLASVSNFMANFYKMDKVALEKQVALSGRTSTQTGNTVILPLYGAITQKEGFITKYYGGTSTETFGNWFDIAIKDSSVSRIIIDVNSPGGSVYGVKELADKIFAARGKKPIVAVVNSLMASAAYWIGAAADTIYSTPSGEAGSVGVFIMHSDYSKYFEAAGIKNTVIKAGEYKAEGNYYEPLSEEALEYLQKNVNDYYDMFTGSVARYRGKTKATVKADFGKGRCLTAKDALAVGMIDGIKTMEDVLKIKSVVNKSKSLAQARLELIKRKNQ